MKHFNILFLIFLVLQSSLCAESNHRYLKARSSSNAVSPAKGYKKVTRITTIPAKTTKVTTITKKPVVVNKYYNSVTHRTYKPLTTYYHISIYNPIGYYSNVYHIVYYDGYGYNFYYGTYGYYETSGVRVVHHGSSAGTVIAIVIIIALVICCIVACTKLRKRDNCDRSDISYESSLRQDTALEEVVVEEVITHQPETVVIEEVFVEEKNTGGPLINYQYEQSN